jgi:ketosteroid isomerase-like protein
MKIRLLLTLAGLASGSALPAFAQQTNTPARPQLETQLIADVSNMETKTAQWQQLRDGVIEGHKKYDQAYETGDVALVISLYADNAVQVNDWGPVYGKAAIQKGLEDTFKRLHFIKHTSTPDQDSPRISPAGDCMLDTGEWVSILEGTTPSGQHFGPLEDKGFYSAVSVKQGDEWKIVLETWNRLKIYPK